MPVAETLTLGEYLAGALYACVSVGFPVAAAWLATRRLLADLDGPALALGFGILALAAVAAVHLLPAVLGLLSRASVAIAATLVLAAATALPRAAGAATRRPPAPAGALDRRLAAGLAAALACAGLYLALAVHLAGGPPTNVDTLTFHLPGVAAWLQEGTIWSIDQFIPDQAHAYYPQTGNLLELAAVLPWDSPFLIRLTDLPLVAVIGLGIYVAARELAAPSSSAMAAAAAACSLPAVSIYAVEKPLPDAAMLAGFAAGGAFLLRHARTGSTRDLALAGVGLSIAFGSKWYGVSSVLVVLAVWLCAQLLTRRRRQVLRPAAALGGIVAAGGGIWLLRNLTESGNPVFPAELAPLGVTIFDSPPNPLSDRLDQTIADYIGDAAAWSDYILPAFADFLGLGGAVLGVGLLACLATVGLPLRRRTEGVDRMVLACCICGLLLAAAYAITPFSALGPPGRPDGVGFNTRYLVPALLVAAACSAALLGRLGPRTRLAGEVLLLLAVIDGIRRTSELPARTLALGVVAAGLGAAGIWLAIRHRGALSRFAARRRVTAAAALALAAILILGAGYRLQDRYLDPGYAGQDATVDRILLGEPAGIRIGLAGEWDVRGLAPVLPAFGPRLRNRVRYVGDLRDGFLRPYGRAADFAGALSEGEYRLLLVGRARANPDSATIVEWATAAGYRTVAVSKRFVLLRAPEVFGA